MTNEELVALIQAGDHASENMGQLFQQNRGFIGKLALPFSSICEMDDLLQEAYFGLQKAVDRYDATLGYKFLTYAESWISQSLQRYCQNNSNLKRIPAYMLERISKYQKFRSDYRAVVGEEPSDYEYRIHLGIKQAQLNELRKYIAESAPISLDEVLPGTEDYTLADTVADSFNLEENVVDEIGGQQISNAIWGAVADLKDNQATVIEGYFKNSETLEQIGSRLEISQERVRQIKYKAISALRRNRTIRAVADLYGYHSSSAFKGGFRRWNETGISSTEFLAIKRIELQQSQEQVKKEMCSISTAVPLMADRMAQKNGYVPRGIQRLQELNAEIERSLQKIKEERAVKNDAEARKP